MRALILAAGRGERMRPLTDRTPKPLLAAGGKRLIDWQIEALVRAGIVELAINLAHLPDAFAPALGDGSRFGARIAYLREGEAAQDALETLGGIVNALEFLREVGDTPFAVVSGDIVTDYDYRRLHRAAARIALGQLDAHLVLVPNPPYHPAGDMGLHAGRITRAAPLFTYANIGVFAPRLFAGLGPVRARLFPWLYRFVDEGRVEGELWQGRWFNVGTSEQLQALDAALAQGPARASGQPLD